MFWFIVFIFLFIALGDLWPIIFLPLVVFIFFLFFQSSNKKPTNYQPSHSPKPITHTSIGTNEPECPRFSLPDISSQTRYHQYKVKGKNPATNRLKTCVVVAREGSSDLEIGLLSGFNEPYTITFDTTSFTEIEPSIKQMKYAKDLGITIPANCSFADLSSLISMQTGEYSKKLRNNGQAAFAAIHGVCLSPYCSYESAILRTLHPLRSNDYVYYFVYLVYCFSRSKEVENPDTSPCKTIFRSFPCDTETVFGILSNTDYDQVIRLVTDHRFDRRHKKFTKIYDQILSYLNEQSI